MKINKKTVVDILAIVAPIASLVLTFVGDWANCKSEEEHTKELIDDAFAKRNL